MPKKWSQNLEEISTFPVIILLFEIVESMKTCLLTDEQVEKYGVYIKTIDYYSAIQRGNPAICDNIWMDPGEYYAYWNIYTRHSQIHYDLTWV